MVIITQDTLDKITDEYIRNLQQIVYLGITKSPERGIALAEDFLDELIESREETTLERDIREENERQRDSGDLIE